MLHWLSITLLLLAVCAENALAGKVVCSADYITRFRCCSRRHRWVSSDCYLLRPHHCVLGIGWTAYPADSKTKTKGPVRDYRCETGVWNYLVGILCFSLRFRGSFSRWVHLLGVSYMRKCGVRFFIANNQMGHNRGELNKIVSYFFHAHFDVAVRNRETLSVSILIMDWKAFTRNMGLSKPYKCTCGIVWMQLCNASIAH